jgi:Skp family chaperone for outer membrane proteins
MKKMILFVAILILVAFVSGAMAQGKPAPAKPATTAAPAPAKPEAPAKLEKFSGTIDKVDEMAKAIAVKGKVKKEEKMMTFSLDDKTKITKGKASLSFADLKKDMHVSVEYKKDGDKMIAVAIKASAPKAAPKK